MILRPYFFALGVRNWYFEKIVLCSPIQQKTLTVHKKKILRRSLEFSYEGLETYLSQLKEEEEEKRKEKNVHYQTVTLNT